MTVGLTLFASGNAKRCSKPGAYHRGDRPLVGFAAKPMLPRYATRPVTLRCLTRRRETSRYRLARLQIRPSSRALHNSHTLLLCNYIVTQRCWNLPATSATLAKVNVLGDLR